MANVTGVTKHFPIAKEGFTTTSASTVGSGATTVPLNSVTGYTNGDNVVLVIEPANATNKQAFTGIVDTAGVQITNVVWTEGTNTTHNAGSTVVDYVAATHMDMVTKGLLVSHNQDGTIKNAAVSAAAMISDNIITPAKLTSALRDGWEVGVLPAVSSVSALGNHSYSVTFASTVAAILTPGMRLRLSRTSAAPTQCTDLESGSSQYYSKTTPAGMTFTDDFVISAWVKLESYGTLGLASRYNGTSGLECYINSVGQITMLGHNAGSANFSQVQSYQSVPLNRWVHVAAQLDMSAFTATTTTSYVMIDGVDVPAVVTRGGTNPTALIQAGDLQVGALNGGSFFDGKIAQLAIYSAKVLQATVLASINQTLTGSETSLAAGYSFNNTILDLSANDNDLSANGGAVATNADSPFALDSAGVAGGTYEWGIVTKIATTVATVQTPEGSAIPTTGGVSAADYSSWKAPFGFPAQRWKWVILSMLNTQYTQASATISTWYNVGNQQLYIPIGEWRASYQCNSGIGGGTGATIHFTTLSSANNTQSTPEFSVEDYFGSAQTWFVPKSRQGDISQSSAGAWYLNQSHATSGTPTLYTQESAFSSTSGNPSIIFAECAYL